MTTLRVSGPYEFTDLRVLDPQLREIMTGTGYLVIDLSPGIYRLEARVPGALEQRMIAIPETGMTTINDLHLPFDSPAPIPIATSHHRDHEEFAASESHQVHVALGDDPTGRLFILLRGDGGSRPEPPRLRLQNGLGETIASCDRHGVFDLAMGVAALSVALPAGTYALANEDPGLGLRGQPVFVEEGWSTQLFVPWDLASAAPSRALASMLPAQRGFDPGTPWEYDHVEAALDGLAQSRTVLTRYDEMDLLDAKFRNPMLGLIGAYSYLTRNTVDCDRLRRITHNLLSLLPHSPDAQLLYRLAHIESDQPSPSPPAALWTEFGEPPMFSFGTDLLLRMAARDAGLVPAASWTASVAVTRTVGSVWTRWAADLDPGRTARDIVMDTVADGRGAPADYAEMLQWPLSVVEEHLTVFV